MDEGLFAKHVRTLHKRVTQKQEIIQSLIHKTGVSLSDEEIQITGKQVLFTTSSVKKAALMQKGIQKILTELGYTLKS